MSAGNPEQPVIDEIDRLVDWQIEEGQRRGDGPIVAVHHNGVRVPSYSHGGTTFVPIDPTDPFTGYYQFPRLRGPSSLSG